MPPSGFKIVRPLRIQFSLTMVQQYYTSGLTYMINIGFKASIIVTNGSSLQSNLVLTILKRLGRVRILYINLGYLYSIQNNFKIDLSLNFQNI